MLFAFFVKFWFLDFVKEIWFYWGVALSESLIFTILFYLCQRLCCERIKETFLLNRHYIIF